MSESDPDDNEPLSKLISGHVPVKAAKVAKKIYTWTKETFLAPNTTFSGDQPQAPDEIASPLQYFRKFISDEMLATAVNNTNQCSVQKDGKSTETDVKELEKVIDLQMGIVKMPGVRYYWENETGYPPVADAIARNRFQELLTVLHFTDNFSVPDNVKSSDRIWKLRLWIECFRQSSISIA